MPACIVTTMHVVLRARKLTEVFTRWRLMNRISHNRYCKMRLLSLRLTHKITAIGVIGVIGVVLIGGIHFYGERAMGISRDAAERVRAVFELNNRIAVELLEGRRAEKDFLLRSDPARAQRQ